MKELSIEEKAKAYDEAIKVAQRFYNNSVAITKKGLEDIFPELKESEDEEIKEMLKVAVERTPWMQNKKEKCYEWLEAQGEQKPAWSEEDEGFYIEAVKLLTNQSLYEICVNLRTEIVDWLKFLKDRYTWKPSLAQLNALSIVSKGYIPDDVDGIISLYNDLKKLREDKL